MSTQSEQQTEQPGPDRESSSLTRLSEEQLKIALTEMADSHPTFLQHLFKQAATTEDGRSPSPPKDGPGTSNPSGNPSHGKPAPLLSLASPLRFAYGEQLQLCRTGHSLDASLPSHIPPPSLVGALCVYICLE